MTRSAAAGLALLLLAATAQPACAPAVRTSAAAPEPEVVHVAPPTGERAADRASIVAALERVQPGGTVQFAAGTYRVGRFIDISVPRITLLGHPDGTTIRGCDAAELADMGVAMVECNGLNLTGGGQTVRALAFEYTWHSLVLGGLTCEAGACRPDSPPIAARTGGYVVEGSTFRESQNGIRVVGEWSEPASIRDNRFINTYHAVVVNGMTAHIVDNLISVPEPERVPNTRHPGGALAIMGWDAPNQPAVCDNNVIAGNRVTGHPDAILIAVAPGGTCRGTEIRNNTIEWYAVRFTSPSTALFVRSAADSTIAGVPIALLNGVFGDGTIEDNLIEGNRIVGASGLAVQVTGASRNRIVNNTITGVALRDPFPGNTLFAGPPEWGGANGSGIWISRGSDENEIVGNTFEDFASYAVVLEGDRNRVETRTPADAVRDLGSGNQVNVRAAPPGADPGAAGDALVSAADIAALTARYVESLNDEWAGGVGTLFASDATLALGGGTVLDGRDAIVGHFFRPTIARIRGLVVASSEVIEADQRVTVVTTYSARFAPAPDAVRGSFSNTWARQPDGSWLIAAATFELPGWQDDGAAAAGIRSGFFESDGLRLHYLDSGGDGVPLLFMPVRDRTAYSFIEFAERFTDRHRVLAITSRGTGQSGGELEDVFSLANAARDAIALLDALQIERAVVVPAWSADIGIILGNLHPDRLAGLIFSNGPPTPDLFELLDADSTGILAMAPRLYFALDGLDADEGLRRMRARQEEAAPYRGLAAPIRVPALAFVGEMGTADVEGRWETELGLARWVADEPGMFGDSVSREFYLKLASDERLQESVRVLYRDFVAPRYRAVEQAFSSAFGAGLRLVPVEARAIGYGYRDAPGIIYPHIRRFLDDVIGRETHDVGWPTDTVFVAPPTGEREVDRASILAALEQVRPGGIVQFAAGTYLTGEIIHVSVPRVSLLGRSEGTTLRGCDPAEYAEDPLAEPLPDDLPWPYVGCNGLHLTGGQQTVRRLAFEYAWHGLLLGMRPPMGGWTAEPEHARAGGYLVEGNTFRNSTNGIRTVGEWTEPAVIRGNTFVNTYHAVAVNGMTTHVLENDISVPEPERVPIVGFPGSAIAVSPPPWAESCERNVIAGNRIEGHPDGIEVIGFRPEASCRHNEIRDNTILIRRVSLSAPLPWIRMGDEFDHSVVGVPIALGNDTDPDFGGASGGFEHNLIEGNRIIGAEGIGIEIRHASRNQVVNNTLTGVLRREPFPGSTLGHDPLQWREANGAGIWVSPGSDENEIIGNAFDDIASHAVVLEGNRNRVERRTPADAVRDLGRGNRVSLSTDRVDALRRLADRFIAAWNDEFPDLVERFYAPDAVLTLPGGTIVKGRHGIVETFVRPNVARISGMRPAGDPQVGGTGDTITLDRRYRARFAPSPDTIEIRVSNTWALQSDGSWLITASTFELPTDDVDGPIRSRFIHADGTRLHYLDFGGDGLPLLFIPSAERTAYTYIDFAARFTDRYRVLALTRRGSGQSGGEAGEAVTNVARLASDVLALLDSLGIERAVVVDRWTEIPIYLAEQHPERLAALVMLRGVPPEPDPFALRAQDETRLLEMYDRAGAAMFGRDPDRSGPRREDWYEPRFLRTGAKIDVPTLSFMIESDTPRWDVEWEFRVGLADEVAGDPQSFPDSLSRSYFQRLVTDARLQAEVQAFYQDAFAPAWQAAERAFFDAFTDHRIVRLEGENPRNYYQYRHAPELIYPHIRQFLNEAAVRERGRSSAAAHASDTVAVHDLGSGNRVTGSGRVRRQR